VGKRGLTPYDASDTNQNSQIFVRRVNACEESAVLCTFRCVEHIVNIEDELIERVRCRPLLYDPFNREYRNKNVRKKAAISRP
jgi:exonuclease I